MMKNLFHGDRKDGIVDDSGKKARSPLLISVKKLDKFIEVPLLVSLPIKINFTDQPKMMLSRAYLSFISNTTNSLVKSVGP